MNHKFDIIIIGTGAGGGAVLDTLKHSGKRILVLERGTFMLREKENWDAVEVFQKGRYHNAEDFYDDKGEKFQPEMGYWVGGNTKVYGAAMFRLREQDFKRTQHSGGVSPEWPLTYADFEPYYTKAEKLFNVHGQRGLDPTEPYMSEDYPNPPISHEPVIQDLYERMKALGYQPSYLPMGLRLNEANRLNSECIRCDTCDGFPCLIHAKADADINCVRPAMGRAQVTLLTNAQATRLITSASGNEIKSVEVEVNGVKQEFSADVVVVACGAINSSLLFLQSANDKHPNGLANQSDQLGRNFMKHQNAAIMALSRHENPTVFQKTMAVADFYFGDKEYEYPMGHVQLMGKSNKHMLAADAPKLAPGFVLEEIAGHTIDWWLTSEDLPDPNNRIELKKGKKIINYTPNNEEAFQRLQSRWKAVLQECEVCDTILDHQFYLGKTIPLAGVAHQNGTMRFGPDPKTSVLDLNCKTHEIDNLYVVDGSFFVSCGAVNPSLTIIANAIRVGEHIIDRMS
ncbi:GMC oxidoreductase [Persicitalea jodogahamensis]|uniref:Dehydrogenase n=1 Tax=Persicitalea jodogahamensis TaxID=402147 RepID=A0A8J3GBA0_9BACT|nr:GMC family oxidoreductase [Persicitalea jodogahamensis]GHB80370.1 dehydrogenase [Persicitalea jodogahamensis]